MEILFGVVIVAVLITVVGHALWCMAAFVLRGFRSRAQSDRYEPTLSNDRAAAARYLEYMRVRGLLDATTYERLMSLIAADVRAGAFGEPIHPGERAPKETTIPPPAVPAEDEMEWEVEPPSEEPSPAALPQPPAQPAPASTQQGAFLESIASAVSESALPPAPEPPPEPRRPLASVLASFMAEKNIRWGELIGGVLILCCSTALVISLWSQIAAIPVLKFAIFTAVTAALFGAGLFVHHRWKLPTTGRAVLLIAAMLVPLNFLAFAAFSMLQSAAGGGGTWAIAIQIASVILFAWLTFQAGRIVMADGPLLFAAGIIVLSAPALAIRFALPYGPAGLWGMAVFPIAVYILVMAVAAWRTARGGALDEPQIRSVLLQLGVQGFACLVPLGLLLYETGHALATLQSLAPLLCAYAVPGLVVGLFAWRQSAMTITVLLRTFALSVALLAMAIMLGGIALSWPTPSRLLPALLVNAAAMIVLGRLTHHSAVQATASLWLAAAWVLGVHLLGGSLSWSTGESATLLAALLSARTGQALVAAVMACLLLAAWLARRQRVTLAGAYLGIAAVFFLLSTALVTAYGFGRPGDPRHIAWVYAAYALAAFIVARQAGSRLAAWIGAIMGQAAVVELLVFIRPLPDHAWPTALLIGATVCTVAATILHWFRFRLPSAQFYIMPLAVFALLVSLSAAGLLGYALPTAALPALAIRTAWLSGLWLVLAFLCRWPQALAGSQIALVVAAGFVVQHHLRGQPWYPTLGWPLYEPLVWQAHLLAAGALCLVWTIARFIVDRWCARVEARTTSTPAAANAHEHPASVASDMLNPVFPAADHWLTGLVVLGLAFLSIWAVAPGVAAEHGWPAPQGPAGLVQHAAGAGSWILWAIAIVTLIIRLTGGLRDLSALALLVAVDSGIALLAARFEARHQVVSLLRWLPASAFLLGSAVGWLRGYLLDRANRLSPTPEEQPPRPSATWLSFLFLLFALPALAFTGTFAVAIGRGAALLSATTPATELRILLLGPVLPIIIGLFGTGVRERRPILGVNTALLAGAAVTTIELCLLSRAGLGMSYAYAVWLVQLNVIVSSAIAVLWGVVHTLLEHPDTRPQLPAWPFVLGRFVLGLVLLAAVVALWLEPSPVLPLVGEAGTIWGIFAVIFVEGALLTTGQMAWPARVWSRLGLWGLLAVVLLASALMPFDSGNWLCFHTMLIGFVVAGWLRLIGGTRHAHSLVGAGWQETFETAAMQARGDAKEIGHDVSCSGCGYNLRGLSPSGRCPECNAPIADSLRTAVSRLSPEWWVEQVGTRARTAAMVLTCAVLGTLFALRAVWGDPGRPWWSAGVLVAAGLLCLVLGGWAPRRAFAYVGAAEIGLAASVWWAVLHWQGTSASLARDLSNIININVMALAAAGVAWLFVERWMILPRIAETSAGRWPAFHHAAAVVSTAVVSGLAGLEMYGHIVHRPLSGVGPANWLAWGAAVVLMAACCLRPAFRYAQGGLYLLGLAAIALGVSHTGIDPRALPWSLSLALAAYVLLTTLLWRILKAVLPTALAAPNAGTSLFAANGFCTLVSVVLGVYVSFTEPALNLRLLIAVPPVLCAAATIVTLWRQPGTAPRTCCLTLLAGAGVLFAWAWVPNGAALALLLQRAIGLIATVTMLSAILGLASGRTTADSPWCAAIAHCLTAAWAVGGAVLLFAAGYEALTLAGHQAVVLPPAAIAVAIAALALMIVNCIAFATSDRFDPLRLGETAKEAYVYLAEWLAAVLALHVRSTMPWLFTGFITRYWPLLVVALASIAVAAGEVCTRYALRTLARPLRRTGLFLPALILPELFLASSEVHYSIVLLIAGVLYAVLAGLRRSVFLGMLSAASITGSLWYLLYRTPGLGLAEHPQLWFVPPALAVLLAGHLNRARLGEQDRRALHYACLLAIYLSSTADIFLIGVAQAPWLPLVLAGLSVAGIMVGIAARVRSFLVLGTGFLCLSLLTMIWHAAANLGWTWVWYVAGIALGAAIITLFALFEKKRREMTAWFDELKH